MDIKVRYNKITIFENSLPSTEDIRNLDTDCLLEFLKNQRLNIKDDSFSIINEQQIIGDDFIYLIKEDIIKMGIKVRPAKRIANLIEKLREVNDKQNSFGEREHHFSIGGSTDKLMD